MARILIVPGLRNSGPTHWQSWFETQFTDTLRVEQHDWTNPCLADWAERVSQSIDQLDAPCWIVAHSFGCLASVVAGFAKPDRVLGALLVAPADPKRFNEPETPLENPLNFPSLVIASNNDPWVRPEVAVHWATQWGSDYFNVGEAGHINVDSGHGPWPEGLDLFEQLRRSTRGREISTNTQRAVQ